MNDTNLKYIRWAVAGILAVAALASVLLQSQVNGFVATSMAVRIPEVVATAINIGIIALLTVGLTWVFNVLGVDLRGTIPAISLVISSWIVAQLQGIIDTIPAAFDPYVTAFLYLLTILLGSAGLLRLFNKEKAPEQLL